MNSFQTIVEAALALHGQSMEDPEAVRVGLETDEGDSVLLSAVRLPGDRDGIEIWIPVVAEDSAPARDAALGRDSPLESWLLMHRLNHESRFVHEWRIVSGEESRPGLRLRLPLDSLDPESLARTIDEGIDRALQVRRVLTDLDDDRDGSTPTPPDRPGVTMIRA